MGEAEYIVRHFTVKKVIFNIGEFNTLEKDLIKVLEEKNVKYYQNLNELKVDDTKFYFLNTKEYDNENDKRIEDLRFAIFFVCIKINIF